MSGHTRWEHTPALPDRHAREVQMAYVDGYRLACEDMLKDLKDLKAIEGAHALTLLAMKRRVGKSLQSATYTLKRLEARPQHVCSEPYYCPTAGEVESCLHGGFDICCDRPELHRPSPDLESRDDVREEVPPAG